MKHEQWILFTDDYVEKMDTTVSSMTQTIRQQPQVSVCIIKEHLKIIQYAMHHFSLGLLQCLLLYAFNR